IRSDVWVVLQETSGRRVTIRGLRAATGSEQPGSKAGRGAGFWWAYAWPQSRRHARTRRSTLSTQLAHGTPVRHKNGGPRAPIGIVAGRVTDSIGGRAEYRVTWPDGRTSVVPGADLVPLQTRPQR